MLKHKKTSDFSEVIIDNRLWIYFLTNFKTPEPSVVVTFKK